MQIENMLIFVLDKLWFLRLCGGLVRVSLGLCLIGHSLAGLVLVCARLVLVSLTLC